MLGLTKKTFDEVINKNDYVIVDFGADWCGPCRMIEPVFEKVSDEFEKVIFAKVDVDKETELATTFGIMSIPCIILFKKGKEEKRIIGYRDEDALRQEVKNLLK